ncbi:unnamed protein product [Porites evermanni]|uniref:Schlafen AlbA-2 domain-containing protein n=1 Tax=Porites evermanni TaxID=104178 RepID=A0ABN8LIG9_9CNID|nr:unnamed protein product [Porites evermanni]
MTRFSEVSRRFYVLHSVVPFEEDTTHEFKGHRNISIEEIPHWCFIPGTDRRSRKAVSRNINGFLNTGKGGTIYLGIVDNGSIKGLNLTLYQKDHVIIAVKDALSRYTPPVPEEYYKVEIVPVIRKEEVGNVETALRLQHDRDDEETTNRHRPHVLRTSEYCWCDREAIDAFNEGLPAPLYVVEITVFPWKPKVKTEKGQHCPNLHPVYEDEEGKCYFRRQASLVQYSVQEVVELTKQEVHNHFKPLFSSIKEEMKMIKEHYFSLYNHIEGS